MLMNYKIIAVDFDGTLCEDKWPEIGEPNHKLIAYVKKKKAEGVKLILWTCRTREALANALIWCHEQGLEFDAVNENLEDVTTEFGAESRKVYYDELIDDKVCTIFNLPYHPEEPSTMTSWSEKEASIACKLERAENDDPYGDEWDYGCSCYDSALKAFKSLMEDGHSGFSIGATKHILNRMIDGKPLTPIEDTDDVWNDISMYRGEEGYKYYQCKRMSALFKYVYADGSVKYMDIDRYHCVDINNGSTYHCRLAHDIVDKLYPITMPYYPGAPIKVYCEDFLVDPKNGDFDTKGIFYLDLPDVERVEINEFYREPRKGEPSINGWKRITGLEYAIRKLIKKKR